MAFSDLTDWQDSVPFQNWYFHSNKSSLVVLSYKKPVGMQLNSRRLFRGRICMPLKQEMCCIDDLWALWCTHDFVVGVTEDIKVVASSKMILRPLHKTLAKTCRHHHINTTTLTYWFHGSDCMLSLHNQPNLFKMSIKMPKTCLQMQGSHEYEHL